MVKNMPANAGYIRDVGSIPGSGRSSEGGYGNLLQYSCLENPMDRGAWQATVYKVTKSHTRRSNLAHLVNIRKIEGSVLLKSEIVRQIVEFL